MKKLGYNEKTLAYYTSEGFFHWVRAYIYDVAIPDLANSSNKKPYKHIIDAMSLYEAQKWLREEKNIEANASFDKIEDGWIAFIQRLDYPDLYGTDVFSTVYNTYESALLVTIKEVVKTLKEE